MRDKDEKSHEHGDDIRHRDAVTDYRPNDDTVKGGNDRSVQAEAVGAEGDENLLNSGATSGGAAGRLNDLEPNATPRRDGGENPENRRTR